MKFFNSLFRVCLIFYTYDSANLKSIGNNTMKNATCYCAGPAYYRMCSTDVYCSKQTSSSSTKGNHHLSFRFWNWAEENCRCKLKFVACRNVVKTETQQTFKWIARFYYFSIYTPLEARVAAHNNCMSCPSTWATSICTAH